MSIVELRTARETDSAELAVIYEPYVLNTNITFEYKPPTAEEFAERIRTISADYPYIVCTIDNKIVGYAYATRHYTRAAYRWNAELSLYVSDLYQHMGMGKAFYGLMEELLKLQNIKNLLAIITYPNKKSINLSKVCGFNEIAVFPKAGFKMGEWHNVVHLEKEIGERNSVPEEIKSFSEINREVVEEVLNKWKKFIKV